MSKYDTYQQCAFLGEDPPPYETGVTEENSFSEDAQVMSTGPFDPWLLPRLLADALAR